ncbi:MAG: hypothetical protein L3J89_06890 [Gammaproteobacteria bacterium]|nr:hypothetical protein [Gammaproteobacteria bacterium]
MASKALVASFTLLINTTVAAATSSNSITVGNEWAYSTQAKQTQKFETTLKPEIEINSGRDMRLTAIGRIRYDAKNQIDVDNDTDAELREFYLETTIGRSFLTLGKQQIVWGKADGLKVLDVVNPQEWREFILDDFDQSRIPLWTVNAEIPVNDVTLQLLWIPDQTYHKFAAGDDLYTFTSPQQIPQLPDGVTRKMAAEERPDNTLQDADWGARLSTFWNGWDLTFNYLYHYDDRPVLYRQLSMTTNGLVASITPRYERSHLIGTTFSNAFGDFTLRGEAGYSLDRYISTNDATDLDGIVKTSELAYVIGMDWSGFSDTLLSTQVFQSLLSDYLPSMIRQETETTLTFLARRDLMNQTVSATLLWIHNLDFDDGLARPEITYQLNDVVSLKFGADIFYGDQIGLFGQFKKNNRVITSIEASY